MFKHRLTEPVKDGIDKGYNLFFIYGNGVQDYFFYNFYEGILSARETYKRFFLEGIENSQTIAETYVYINTKEISCFKNQDDKCVNITSRYFEVKQPKDDLDDEDSNQPIQSEEAKNIQRNAEQSNTEFKNNLARLKDIIKERKEKTVVYFEGFEWIAGLYSSNKDESIEYIKRVKDLVLEKNVFLIVSISDIELLKPYHFNMEGTNCIYVGNPSAQEIKFSFLRRYLRAFEHKNDLPLNVISIIDDIAHSIASSNKDLRNSIRIYDGIVQNRDEYVIDKKDFEIAIEKISEEKVTIDEIVLDQGKKDAILRAVDNFIENDDNKNYRKGLILTGPPGTGKTILVKAIANERNCYFMAPTLSELKGEYVGQSSAKVKRVFEQARANQPSIIFIDEADAVFAERNLGSGTDSFNQDMVNQFLVEIDGMKTGKQKIFVIAATNRIGILDSAIRSRLSEEINIGLPDKNERKLLFHKKLCKHNFLFTGKSFSEEIAEKTENMSGRDIENFVKRLNEMVMETPYKKMVNLSDNEDTKQMFLKALKATEISLINDLQRNIPVEIRNPKDISVGYEDIIGYENIKEKIGRQVKHLTSNEKERLAMERYEVKTSKGILLYGPPGNAKSKLAEATAKKYNLYYIKVLSKDFVSNNVEKQLQSLQTIFEQTLRLSKMCTDVDGVLLFFDEFDSLASVNVLTPIIRGTVLDYLSNDTHGVRAKYGKVLLMAATNFYELLDEALIRKGRIDEHIFMDNPTIEHGKEIIDRCLKEDDKIQYVSTQKEIYNKLLEKKKQEFIEKKCNILNSNFDRLEEYKQKSLLEFAEREARPSGADIIELYQEMKVESYYSNKFDDNEKLIIDEEIADKILEIR